MGPKWSISGSCPLIPDSVQLTKKIDVVPSHGGQEGVDRGGQLADGAGGGEGG